MASYREVLTVKNYTREMGKRTLLKDISLAIERGDHIGLIGPNGSGKTTLLKGIVGEDDEFIGEINLGNRVSPGYFDQNLELIVDEGTVIDQIWDEHPKFQAFELRSYLARFLFSGEEVFKSVKTLSGGERARLALAKLILTEANFLILDEPTNHLDIPSREVLESALKEFEGTLLVVSHDRYFLNEIINKLAVIRDQTLDLHLGTYSEYQERIARQGEDNDSQPEQAEKQSNTEWEQLRQQRRDRQKRERERNKLEQAIHRAEERLQEIDDLLVDETIQHDWQRLAELGDEKKLLTGQLEELYPQWEAFAEED
jgi:ATP-binding cassette subfamily F protein 3